LQINPGLGGIVFGIFNGTANGLIRFDGIEFDTFDISGGSLKDNEVSCLIEDDAGRLWAGITTVVLLKFMLFFKV
jgi:hypothetical protein